MSGVWREARGGLFRRAAPDFVGWCVSLGGRGGGERIFRMRVPLSGSAQVEFDYNNDLPGSPLSIEQIVEHGHFAYRSQIGDQELVDREADAGAIIDGLARVSEDHLVRLPYSDA